MVIGYMPIILLLIIALGNIAVSLKVHKIVRTSDASNILVLGIVTMVILALKDLNSFSLISAIACVFMGIVVFKDLYDEYQIQIKNKSEEHN